MLACQDSTNCDIGKCHNIDGENMVAYLDLMAVAHIALTVVSLAFVSVIDVYRVKKKGYVKFVVLSLPLIFLIYANIYVSGVVMILTYGALFFLYFKKDFLKPLVEFLFCYYFVSFMMSLISPMTSIRHFVFVVHNPLGVLVVLVCPIYYLLLISVTKMVDKLYRLKDYITEAVIVVDGQKAKFKCYFDSGNTLKYHGVPVIFCRKDSYPFAIKDSENKIVYQTLAGEDVAKLQTGVISLSNGDYSLVYIGVLDKGQGFNGCECLLNAYLGW